MTDEKPEGKLIQGSFGAHRKLEDLGVKVDVTPSPRKEGCVDITYNFGDIYKVVREAHRIQDKRARCKVCGAPATREDGFCNPCRLRE